MRAFEFLKEASVFKTVNSQYVPGYRLNISTGASGKKTIDAINQQIPDFSQAEEFVIADPKDNPNFIIALPGKAEKSFKIKRSNGQVIQINGSKNAIEQSLNAVGAPKIEGEPEKLKMPNKGDTAEALLGAAMFAKLQKRQGDTIGQISSQDLWTVFDKLKPITNEDYMVTSKDLGGATDKIWFKLKVKNTVKNALANQELRKKLDSWAQSPINFVNSKDGTEYAQEFYKNGEPDEVGIISDGLSEQTQKKTDVYIVVRDPVTGQIGKELLPVSLKAGAEQFAQHSGSKFSAMEDMFNKLGINLPNLQSRYDSMINSDKKIEAASMVYKYAADRINQNLGDNKSEAGFIEKLASALKFWATSDMDNVRVVSFGSKGQYDVLRFDNLLPKMKLIKLKAEFLPGDNPKIVVMDDQEGTLFQMRTYLQSKEGGTYQRNVIEKGPLLTKIANALEE
jgi:hypothetical protein